VKTPEAVFSWAVSSRTTGNDTPIADVVVRNSVSITLDGRLDETVWRGAL